MEGQVVTRFHDNLILVTLKELTKEKGFKFHSSPQEVYGHNEWDSIQCHIDNEDMEAAFQLQQMPGCCAVLTLSYIKCNPWTQENVFLVTKLAGEAAYRAGFGSVMMTQVVPAYSKMLWKQEPWILCLKDEWKVSDPFRNAKSGNLVVYLTKDLGQKHKVDGLERVEIKQGKEV